MTIRARVVEAPRVETEQPLRFEPLVPGAPDRTTVRPTSEQAGRLVLHGREGQRMLVHLAAPAAFGPSEADLPGNALQARLTLHGQAGEEESSQPLGSSSSVTLGPSGKYYLRLGGGLTARQVPAGQYQSQATLVIAYDT